MHIFTKVLQINKRSLKIVFLEKNYVNDNANKVLMVSKFICLNKIQRYQEILIQSENNGRE